jgi:SAM-dependent methyltransferase
MSSTDFVYEGSELAIFEHATNWKRYWSAHVRRHLGDRVLEVGAGIGANTPYLNRGASEWVCLEPDKKMAALLAARLRANELRATEVIAGTVRDLPAIPRFDSIVYIDVLEHIEDDRAEIAEAVKRLRSGGMLIALGPAHEWLFSAFDKSIGHFRRYSVTDFRALTRPEVELFSIRQLDSVGMLASIANRFVLRQEIPSMSQIMLWDRLMVPISRLLDPFTFYRFGKSILATWRRR